MVNRITVTLEQNEYSALTRMAIDDLRNPSDQLRHILRLAINKQSRNSPKNENADHQPALEKTDTNQSIIDQCLSTE